MKKLVFTVVSAIFLAGFLSSCTKEDIPVEPDQYAIDNGEIKEDDI